MASSVTQHTSNIPIVASATVAKAFASPPAVNSTIVVQVASADSAALTLTCADNQAGGTNTYTRETAADTSHTGSDGAIIRVSVFRCKTVNVSAGTFTVTVSGGTSGTFWILGISECTPLDPADASQVNGATSSTNPATATSGTTAATTQADEIAFATLCFDGYANGTGIVTPSGYTSVALANNGTTTLTGSCDFKVLTATGAQTASWGSAISPGAGSPGSWSGSIITFKGAASGATGSAAITEGADTVAGVGTNKVSGTAAITESTDTAAGVGTVAVSGTAAIAEGIDTAAGVGVVAVSGAAAITEGLDTASGIGTVAVSGTAAILEGQDIVAGIGGDAVSGTAGITEGIDTASGVGVSGAGGFASITEGTDTATGTGVVAVTGSAAILEGADTVLGSGTVESDGAAAITESADTVSASGTAASSGTGVAAIFEDGDIVVAAGGAIAITQDTHDPKPWIKRKKHFDDSAQTQVIRESQLKPKKPKRPAKESTAEPVAPNLDAGPEDEEIMLLMDDEDARTADLIELATQILRTLH